MPSDVSERLVLGAVFVHLPRKELIERVPRRGRNDLGSVPRFRKYLEAIIALEMDLILPKDRILELYLNCIEWGKGIFGIGAAAAYHYDCGVGNLGLDEMRRLVTIITNPLRYNVKTFEKSHQMAARYAYLLSRFPDPTPTYPSIYSAVPMETGPVAPIPDAPETETPPAPSQLPH